MARTRLWWLDDLLLHQASDVPLWHHHGGEYGGCVSTSALQLSPLRAGPDILLRVQKHLWLNHHPTEGLPSILWMPAATSSAADKQPGITSWLLEPGTTKLTRVKRFWRKLLDKTFNTSQDHVPWAVPPFSRFRSSVTTYSWLKFKHSVLFNRIYILKINRNS